MKTASRDAIESGEEKYKSLFSNMINGFALHKIILDKRGRPVDYEFIEINSAFEHMTGLKRKDIIGKRVTVVLPGTEKDPADWIGNYGKVALTGKEMRFENYSATLKKWFNISAYSPKEGYFATIFEDITASRQTQENIANSQKLLQRIIDLLPIRIFWKDKDLKFLGCNSIFAKDAGKESPKELVGKDDFQMNWKEQATAYREDDKRVMKSGRSKLDFEEPQTTPTGGKIWLKTSKVPLTDPQGNIIGILGTYEDITERKKTEVESRRSKDELQLKIDELERFNNLTINRELKMIELKKRIRELEEKYGKK